MAYVLTYSSLVAAIEAYLQRTDTTFEVNIPLFILLGERRVARDLKILGLKQFITGDLQANQPLLGKPARWLNTSAFNIGIAPNVTPLQSGNYRLQILQRSYEYCLIYWPDATQLGQPKYYCDKQFQNWMIVPTPAFAYPYEIAYYEIPNLIDDTVSTNWITSNAPDIILYATLLETASYLKDDERIKVWEDYYNKAKGSLSEEDMRRIYDGFSKRGG